MSCLGKCLVLIIYSLVLAWLLNLLQPSPLQLNDPCLSFLFARTNQRCRTWQMLYDLCFLGP